MDPTERQVTAVQIAALVDYVQDHSNLAIELANITLEKESQEIEWNELTSTLNSMDGAVQSVDEWKQLWQDINLNSKEKAVKHQQSVGDKLNSPEVSRCSTGKDPDYLTPKKRSASLNFDEEVIRIKRDKLELDKEYKTKKLEVLSRIAAALEQLAKKE